jgi:hypothetical protein
MPEEGDGGLEETRDSGTNLAGEFRVGPATVMYAPEFTAYSAGGW